jgi:hypothetical protein
MMKRPFTVLVLMLALTACGSDSIDFGGTAGGGTTGVLGTTGAGGRAADGGTTGDGGIGRGGGYATVSGRVVHGDTGTPYPSAYVRFGWLVNANYEREIHTVTDTDGRYVIKLPAGLYQATAGDSCDLNAGFTIVGRHPDDITVEVPGTTEVNFVESPIVPGADGSGPC